MMSVRALSQVLGLAILGAMLSLDAIADDGQQKSAVAVRTSEPRVELTQIAQNTQPAGARAPVKETVADGPDDVRLPDTASPLPMLAAGGLLALAVALVLRSVRERRA